MLSTLEVKLGISGDDTVVSGLKRVKRAEDEAAQGGDGLAKAMAAMEIPALRAVAAAQGLGMAVIGLGAGAIALSGIQLAAQYERLEVGFKTLLGSAGAARQLMNDLSALGQTTPFQTAELSQFARGLLATDASANKALNTMRTLRAVTDAMAATGGSTADVGQAISTLGQMRIATHLDMEQIKVLSHLGVNVPEVYRAATGQKNVAPQIAMARLASMRGQAAFDTIVAGMEKLYGGAASTQAATGLGLLQNIIETLGLVSLPTGRILLAIVKPIADLALHFLGAAQKINEMTGGVAGLAVILTLIIRGWGLLSGVVIAAYTATRQLTAALLEYSAAARSAATSTGTAAAAGAAASAASRAGAAGAAGGAAAAVGAAKAAPAATSGAAGAWLNIRYAFSSGGIIAGIKAIGPEIGTLLRGAALGFGKVLTGALGAGLAAIGLEVLGNWMKGSKNPLVSGAGHTLSNMGQFGGWGSLAGTLIGGAIGGPGGAVIGAWGGLIVGALVGGLKTWWDHAHEKPEKADSTQQAQLQALKDIHSVLIGGGERAGRVDSELKAEYALRRMIFSGAG